MYHPLLLEIMNERGIRTEEERKEFLSQKPMLVYDPFLLTNMEAGTEAILEAVDAGKRIVIYGDYDADGVTSTALLMKVLRCLTDNLTYYIPSRIDEGYGLHKDAIERIYREGGEFIITVDCGSSSPEETRYAHELGIGTVVTDHHNVTAEMAEGIVINPKAPGDTYPFKELAGVGVAYKLALALSRKRDIPRRLIADVLELVTIGTIADIMPLIDENRTIVKYGLIRINQGCRNPGLRRLIELSGLRPESMKAQNISFGIAPRINAAGRVADASIPVRLLLSEDPEEIERLASALMEANTKRRALQEEAYEKCLGAAKEAIEEGDFLLLEAEDVHEGILGIVAGKIKEEMHRPTVIVTPNGEEWKGTARSVPKIDIYAMLDRYRAWFTRFGGHRAACGFTIAGEKIEELREALNQDLLELSLEDESLFEEELRFDAALQPEDATIGLAEALRLLEPCGKGNELPVLKFGAREIRDWFFLKNGTKYAKFRIAGENSSLECLLFHDAAAVYAALGEYRLWDVYGTLEINTWKNTSRVQILVTDMRPAGRCV